MTHLILLILATPGNRWKVSETVFGTLKSGYVLRAAGRLPKQGSHGPWRVSHDYFRDIPMMRRGAIEEKCLEFARPAAARSAYAGAESAAG